MPRASRTPWAGAVPATALVFVACATFAGERPADPPPGDPAPAAAAPSRGTAERPPALDPFRYPPEPPDPEPRPAAAPILITGARILTAAGTSIETGWVRVEAGRIVALGPGDVGDAAHAGDLTVIDAEGLTLTPGIIDTHSHLGVYPMPSDAAHRDGNEMTGATTPHVFAEHAFWPQDPGLRRALAGGVTTIQVLPGSANLVGGRSVTLRLWPDAVSARELRFPGAPQGLKMACGENPKRVYGDRRQAPMTRMGNTAGFRAIFQRAVEYRRRVRKFERDLAAWEERQQRPTRRGESERADDPPDPPARDLGLETMMRVLDGDILVHNHCYRADEMAKQLDLAEEFGFRIRSFHHAVEAYKLRDRLAEAGVAVSTWSDWWGFKLEAFDAIPQNAALLHEGGVRAIIHSDSNRDIRFLNLEAAKAMTAGRRMGIEISDDDALRWITANAAWALGIEDEVGTLEAGKRADMVLWDGDPFSTYSRPVRVFIDGETVFDRNDPNGPRLSDFELGLGGEEVTR
jgi:imidazolonepropionase-like amidohydrolase